MAVQHHAARFTLPAWAGEALGLLLVAALVVVTVISIMDLRASSRDAREQAAIKMGYALAADLNRMFARIDDRLVSTRVRRDDPAFARLEDPAARHLALAPPADSLGQIRSTMVLGPEGQVLFDSSSLVPRQARSDVDAVEFHRTNPSLGLFVSLPFRAGPQGEDVFGVSRRLPDVDGAYAGLVMTVVELQFLHELFDAVRMGDGGSIALIRHDGRLLTRAPFVDSLVGADLSATPVFRAMQETGLGLFRATATVDRTLRTYAIVPVGAVPVSILVGLSEADLLDLWLPAAIRLAAVSGFFALGLLVALWSLRQELLRTRNAKLDVERREARFRGLAEHSPDLICRFDADWVCRYASPAALRLLGTPASELVGQPLSRFVEAADGAKALEGVECQPRQVRRLRVRAIGGAPVRGFDLAVFDVPASPSDESPERIAIFRDMTAQLDEEERLRQLAASDPLTGAGNRRAFDTDLQLALALALHHGPESAVSLIVADIDHFKRLNDEFGHPAGDAVLIAVVATMRQVLRHPNDRIYRLGGEEFAILLPRTNAASARVIAERVRAGVEARPHALAGGDGEAVPVTVSLGVATAADDDMAASDLVLQADIALYAAKRGGRNRVVAGGAEASVEQETGGQPSMAA